MAPGKKKKRNKKPGEAGAQLSVRSLSAANTAKKRKLLFALAVFFFALSLRLVFIGELFLQNADAFNNLDGPAPAGFITNDSGAYIFLAKNFFSGYFGAASQSSALLRTPGYPAFCSPFYRLGLAPAGVLMAQAVLAACIPVLTLLLAYLLTGSLLLAASAGFFSAVSPTGIGLCGLVMSDMLLAFLMSAAVYYLCCAALRGQENRIVLSGVLFSAAFLVKPILVFWPACMIAVYYLCCRAASTRCNWKKLAIAVAVQLVVLGLWCTRNYVYEGVFTPSSVTAANLHDFLRPRVEEWAKAGTRPFHTAVRDNRNKAFEEFIRQNAALSAKEKLQALNARALAVFKAYPLITAKVILQNARENMLAGWDYFPRQLPRGSALKRFLRGAVKKESAFRACSLLAVTVFLLCLCLMRVFKNTAAHRKIFSAAAALGITYGYFAVLSGTTFWAGARIMYPVEFILILLFCMALQQVWLAARGIRLFRKKQAPRININQMPLC